MGKVIIREIPFIPTDLPTFVSVLTHYTKLDFLERFKTDKGWWVLDPIKPPWSKSSNPLSTAATDYIENPLPELWPTYLPIPPSILLMVTGRHVLREADAAQGYSGWLIRFQVVRTTDTSISVRAECIEDAVVSYFDELMEEIIKHWPQTIVDKQDNVLVYRI